MPYPPDPEPAPNGAPASASASASASAPASASARELPWQNPAWTATLVVLACAATFGLKLLVGAPRRYCGHGDVAHYFVLARNLFEGRGMWVDFLATWLSDDPRLPAPGTGYWMPMPAWIGAAGMLATGAASLRAASLAMALFTSVAPWLAYVAGRDFFGSRRSGLIAAGLAATFHLFLDKAALPLTHGPSLVFGGLALWSTVRSLGDRRFLWLAGAMAGLAQSNRSDGILLLAVIVGAHLVAGELAAGRVARLARLWPVAVAYALAIAPLVVTNVLTQGSPFPASLSRVALLTTYPDLYSLPERLTLARYLERGVATIAAEKAAAGAANLRTFVAGLTSGDAALGDFASAGAYGLVGLTWLGVRPLFRRRMAAFWLYAALQWALYSLVFTHTGRTSFRPALYALYPTFLAAAAHGLQLVARFATRPAPLRWRPRLAGAALLFALVGIGVSNVRQAGMAVADRARRDTRGVAFSQRVLHELVEPLGLSGATFLVEHEGVHRFHAHTRLRVASIPFGASLDELRDAAQRIGATHVLMTEPARVGLDWTTLAELQQSPEFERVGGIRMQRGRQAIYRIVR